MKKLGIIILSLLGLVGLLVVAVIMMLPSIVRSAAEQAGTEALGVPVVINDLDIDLFGRSVEIRGVSIGNPEGFSDQKLFSLDLVRVDMGEITEKLMVVEDIKIVGTMVNFEASERGSNFTTVKNNMNRHSSPQSAPQSSTPNPVEKSSQPMPKVIIENFEFNETVLKPNISFAGQKGLSADVVVPDIQLQGIGRKENGILVKDAAKQIFDHVSKKIEQASMQGGLLKGLKGSAVDAIKTGDTQELKKKLGGILGGFGR